MPAFIAFDEFADVLGNSRGVLIFVLTPECEEDGQRLGERLQHAVGGTATVFLLCAAVEPAPKLVFYDGGDSRPLLAREGADAERGVALAVAEAAAEVRQRAETVVRTEQMLANERLDQFPPFFQMARNLARDAWHAARQTAEGAPLMLTSEAAAARLAVCATCPSLRGERCIECGCFMTVKAHLTAMQCPLGKWPVTDSAS